MYFTSTKLMKLSIIIFSNARFLIAYMGNNCLSDENQQNFHSKYIASLFTAQSNCKMEKAKECNIFVLVL